MKVSVIMPTYNRRRYISSAIESILRQTCRDIEIIVVDDGSNDGTEEELRPYFLRLKYIRQEEKKGVAAARNRGLDAVTGDYIAFLDSDDIWLPDKIERQVSMLEADPDMGACHTGFDLIDGNDDLIEMPEDISRFALSGDILKPLLTWDSRVILSSLMVRRSCLEKTGRFDESLLTGEDFLFIVHCARHYRYGYIPDRLLLRRKLSDSLTQMAYTSPANNSTFQSLQKAIASFPEIGRVTRRRAHEVRYFHYGYTNYNRRDYGQAGMFFRKALIYAPFRMKAWAYLFLSVFHCVTGPLHPVRSRSESTI